MAMQESGEMYLETIYVLTRKSNNVRAIDVGEHMGFSKPSVSRAMGLLRDEGMIEKDKDGFIRLTNAGEIKAKNIYERHTVLTKMLISIGVDEETASEDACRIEHYISDKTFNAIKAHMKEHK
ncbi:MAG: metal-dependent transcriptional regulator [Lachnospiraceae bacterium]|nr:metal-dependent transcriptional regulator [Lachnospiraceae bacterium]